jgi:hypothetical protein
VDIALLGLWFVCALGTAVFAALTPLSRAGAMAFVPALALGAWWIRQPAAPATAAVGLAAAAIAAWQLVREPRAVVSWTTAGLLAGLWTGVLAYQGLPAIGAVVIAAALAVTSAWLRQRRAGFAPAPLREEALLFLIVLGTIAAAAPGVVDGWHAAGNFNLQSGEPQTGDVTGLPAWTLTLATTALISGGVYSLWSRR